MMIRKARRLAALCGACLLLASTLLWAQAPAPYPLPNLDLRTNGEIHALLLQPDLSLVIAGRFSQVNGVERHNIARLQPAGQLDPTWDPDIRGDAIHALARDDQGRIYAGGSFDQVGGQARRNLVRVAGSGSGAVDMAWSPQPVGPVHALAVAAGSNAQVYAGGAFTEIGGISRSYLVRLSGSNGQADILWPAAGTNGAVFALQLAADGNSVFIGGRFLSMAGQQRRYLARVNTGNGVTQGWNANIDISGIHAESEPGVYALALGGSHLYVGGVFRQVGGLGRNGLARVGHGTTATVDANWAPQPHMGGVDADPLISAIAIAGDGGIHVGGHFSGIGGQFHRDLARLLPASATGAADAGWDADLDQGGVRALVAASGTTVVFAGGGFQQAQAQLRMGLAAMGGGGNLLDRQAQLGGDAGMVAALARHPDGGMVVGGRFNLVGGVHGRGNLLRLNPAGNLDLGWQPRFNGMVHALAVAGSGVTYVGGDFTMADGQSRMRLARVNSNGSVDTQWNQGAWGGGTDGSQVRALAVAANGSVYVGGRFSSLGPSAMSTVPRGSLARLSGSGSGTPEGWNPLVINGGQPGTVRALALSADGTEVVAGGLFSHVGGQPRNNIVKIATSGGVDPQWSLPANGQVDALAMGGSGQLYVAGWFTHIGGHPRQHLARLALAGNGLADPSWDPHANSPVTALAVADDGAVVASGLFSAIGAHPRAGLARVLASGIGVADPAWNPGVLGLPMTVHAGAEGDIHVGGYFFEVGGEPRLGLARLPGSSDRIFGNGFEP